MAGACGILVLDKPSGPTSHDMVNQVRRLFGTRRVGHSGTLDPDATGVLILGLGRATRILSLLQRHPKTYRAQIAFGVSTTTQDAAGEVVEERPCSFGRRELDAWAGGFQGEILQVPPMVSAVKIGGEALYRAARRGETRKRPARPVTIHELRIEEFTPQTWEATMFVRCSAGTYVRTLAHDLGQRLGCGAHVKWLRRLAAGMFTEDDAIEVPALASLDPGERAARLLPMAAAVADLPSATVAGEDLADVSRGRPLRNVDPGEAPDGAAFAVLDEAGSLIALYRREGPILKASAVLL